MAGCRSEPLLAVSLHALLLLVLLLLCCCLCPSPPPHTHTYTYTDYLKCPHALAWTMANLALSMMEFRDAYIRCVCGCWWVPA